MLSPIAVSRRWGPEVSLLPETDSRYIDLSERVGVDSREVVPGLVLDLDAEEHLVGIDIDHANRIIDLSRLEAEALPISNLSLVRS
jgi:uncharacterized protein YuzE